MEKAPSKIEVSEEVLAYCGCTFMQRYKLLLEKTPSKVEVSEEVDDVGPKH